MILDGYNSNPRKVEGRVGVSKNEIPLNNLKKIINIAVLHTVGQRPSKMTAACVLKLAE